MNKCKYIIDSHKRCEHLQADRIQPIIKDLQLNQMNRELLKSAEDSINKNKTIFFALYNSFITITDHELTVLNCFANKNSNVDLTSYLPKAGTILKENSYGTNAISLANFKKNVAYVVKNEHYRKQSRKLTCVAAPILYRDEIKGYIGISTVNKWQTNGLRAFVESLSYNISYNVIKNRLNKEIIKYVMPGGLEAGEKWMVPYFSEKEKQIVDYIIKGYSNELIADKTCISEATVRTHLKRIFDKCGTKNRVDTAVFLVCSEIMDVVNF